MLSNNKCSILYSLTWVDFIFMIWFSCQAELRASVFEAIEEEDRVIEKEEGLPPALLGSCNDRGKQLHASPSGPPPPPLFLSCTKS